VDHAAFLKSLERGVVPPVLLLHGPDPQLLDDAVAAVTRALFPSETEAALGREVVDAREVGVDAVVRAAMTMPLLAPSRLVVARRAQAWPARGHEALGAYASDPNPAACLLLLADDTLTATRDRKGDHWLLAALPAAAVVALPVRRGRALEEWVRQRAAAEGLTLDADAARLLVEWVGDDSAALLGEVRKAALAGGADNRVVGAREVRAVVGEHRVSGVFDLTRAVERADLGLALRTLDRLLLTEEPLRLLALLAREARAAWTAGDLRARGRSIDEIARALGRPARVVEAMAGAATPAPRLVRRLERCWEVEHRLKSGGDAPAELAALVAELCR
jgi:DNA polymerase-3 subunit delta